MYSSNANKPSKFTGEMYGTKVSVEYVNSDISLDEAMDAFETLLTGLGYHPDALKHWIIERAEEYTKQDNQSEDEGDYFWEENKTNEVISILTKMEVDGDTMQYILEEVGMDEQMAIQLATMYPDVVEEHIAELKAERHPHISDNFQIGPEGAYEHEDEYNVDEVVEAANEDEEIAKAFENFFKTMKAARKNGK